MNQLIRACMMAAFAVGLAFAASIVADDTAEGQQRWPRRGPRNVPCKFVQGSGYVCGQENIDRAIAIYNCNRNPRTTWDHRTDSCSVVYSTGGTYSGRGSCSNQANTNNQRGGTLNPCDYDPAGSGLAPPGSLGGPSFWEWMLWRGSRD